MIYKDITEPIADHTYIFKSKLSDAEC
jgi:hypothetical protein